MTRLVLISKLPNDMTQLAVYSGNTEIAAFRVANENLDAEDIEMIRTAQHEPLQNAPD